MQDGATLASRAIAQYNPRKAGGFCRVASRDGMGLDDTEDALPATGRRGKYYHFCDGSTAAFIHHAAGWQLYEVAA